MFLVYCYGKKHTYYITYFNTIFLYLKKIFKIVMLKNHNTITKTKFFLTYPFLHINFIDITHNSNLCFLIKNILLFT